MVGMIRKDKQKRASNTRGILGISAISRIREKNTEEEPEMRNSRLCNHLTDTIAIKIVQFLFSNTKYVPGLKIAFSTFWVN